MTKVQHLELELEAVVVTLGFLDAQATTYRAEQSRLIMELNRAHRLEREELQNDKPQS